MSGDSLHYYLRHEALVEAARTMACPTCGAHPGHPCRDRWGLITNLVHETRHQAAGTDPAEDPYTLTV